MPRVKTDCRHSGPLSTVLPFLAPKNYTPARSEALRVARPEAVGLVRAKHGTNAPIPARHGSFRPALPTGRFRKGNDHSGVPRVDSPPVWLQA